MEKKTIGVITYWWSNQNYGQILQAYALQKYLSNLGFTTFLIKYNPYNELCVYSFSEKLIRFLKILNPVLCMNYLLNRYRISKKKHEEVKYSRGFELFRDKYLNCSDVVYNSLDSLRRNPPIADVYICGSDIVWSNRNPAFFLDFGSEKTKRIAYAASFGSDVVADEMIDFIKPLIAKFEFIGVREVQGIEVCKKAGRKDAFWVFDPTLLLAKKDYSQITSSCYKKQNFCLLYLLGTKTQFSMMKIDKMLINNNLKKRYVTCERYDKYEKEYLSINEWLGCYESAELVITNSFHGCVFSIIYNKKFILLPLKGKYAGLNVRAYSLLKKLNLSDRICHQYSDLEKLVNLDIDYSKINTIIVNEREVIEKLFLKALEK